MGHPVFGLGDKDAQIRIYIGNRPTFDFSPPSNGIHALVCGEINAISNACGNGWRKVFNVYAKWLYSCPKALYPQIQEYRDWQSLRDDLLLQTDSNTALLFDPPNFSKANRLHIVMGRTYAKSLDLPNSLVSINEEFAIDTINHLIVCPYFDYRQLSNQKINTLTKLIKEHLLPLGRK